MVNFRTHMSKITGQTPESEKMWQKPIRKISVHIRLLCWITFLMDYIYTYKRPAHVRATQSRLEGLKFKTGGSRGFTRVFIGPWTESSIVHLS